MITKGIYFLYRLFLAVFSPLLLLYIALRAIRNPGWIRSLPERLGFLGASIQQTRPGGIWLHAVSVGEVLLVTEVARRLRTELPGASLYVSTSTLAGRALAGQKLAALVDGIFYAPLDYAVIVRRVLRILRPQLIAIAETEIWPNLFRETKRAGCSLVVINGRISDRAASKYRRFSWFFRHVLAHADEILTQSDADRERYLAAGAPASTVHSVGNLKYDVQPGRLSPVIGLFLDRLQPVRIWVAASTMPPDEDDTVVETFQRLALEFPRLLLVLAPRKPERFDLVAGKLDSAGISYVRRTKLSEDSVLTLPGVLLLDTIGELSGVFARADVVFVGGSIVPWGGHNILEPAVFAKPIVVGPHMQNFREMAEMFRSAGALVQIGGAPELTGAIRSLLVDEPRAATPSRAQDLGRKALECAERNRGATARVVETICRLHREAVPRFSPPGAVFLRPVEWLWHSVVAGVRAYRSGRRVRLGVPVISVGNLTFGGTGKTPMVAWLAGQFEAAAILTRGYRREQSEPIVLLPGKTATLAATGDEAKGFLKQNGLSPDGLRSDEGQLGTAVGVGADRVAVGQALLERFPAKVAILDDGFQHWRLERRLDIVLIDGLDPFPPFRLREPLSALGRADVFVITRSVGLRPGIERILRQHNPAAPIFYSRVRPEWWVEGATGRRLAARQLPLGRFTAFCGLANPGSFWLTLDELGIRPERRVAFPDHHRYSDRDLAQLQHTPSPEGDRILLTTEKDWINLDGRQPLGIYWLKITLELDRESEFLDIVKSAC